MKEGWQTRNLGDICRIRTGKKDVNQGNPEGKFPFFTCAAEHTFSDNYSFDTEALLIAGNGDVGRVGYYNGKFEAYQRTYVLSDFTVVSPRFLYLILDGKLKETVSKQKLGNTMPYIKVAMLADFQLPVPPLPEQQRIVALLDEAFAGIATAKANAERNLQNARALFESHLQSVFSQRGEGWVEKRLECLAEIRTGKRDANHQDENGPYPFYTCAFGQFKSPTFSFDGPSIILPGNGANVGKIFFYNGKFEAYQRTYVVNELNYSIIPRFLYFCFTANWSRWIATKQFGSATNYIVVGDLKGFPVPMPPLEVQEVTVEQLELFTEETQHLTRLYERKLAALEELKKSLLHQAFNGEL